MIMYENPLIVLPAWTLNEGFYSKLVKLAPEGKQVIVAPLEKIVPGGEVTDVDKNLLRFMDTHEFRQIDLLGHSLGGALALEFVSRHTDRVGRLFLVDSKGVAAAENIGQALFAQARDWLTYMDRKLVLGLGAPLRILRDPVLHIRLGLYAKNVNLEEEVRSLKVPTFLIWGERDLVIPLKEAERLHHLIVHSHLTVIPGMDHNWLVHSPEFFWNNLKK